MDIIYKNVFSSLHKPDSFDLLKKSLLALNDKKLYIT